MPSLHRQIVISYHFQAGDLYWERAAVTTHSVRYRHSHFYQNTIWEYCRGISYTQIYLNASRNPLTPRQITRLAFLREIWNHSRFFHFRLDPRPLAIFSCRNHLNIGAKRPISSLKFGWLKKLIYATACKYSCLRPTPGSSLITEYYSTHILNPHY